MAPALGCSGSRIFIACLAAAITGRTSHETALLALRQNG
jgi:hypothetical protein